MNIAYCWELGTGLGHVTRINTVLEILSPITSKVNVYLRDLSKSVFINAQGSQCFRAPSFDLPIDQPSPSFAHILWRSGWHDDKTANALVTEWMQLLESSQPDLVILDHAPTASVAAKLLNLPYLHIGNGFELPPAVTPFPSIMPWREIPDAELKRINKEVNKRLEKVSRGLNNHSALKRFQSLFAPEHCVAAVPPLLDHYERKTSFHYLPLMSEVAGGRAVETGGIPLRPNVFVYLKDDDAELINRMKTLGEKVNVFGYTPFFPETLTKILRNHNVHLSTKPLDMRSAIASSDLVVCHGGIGTCAHALNAAKPLVILPIQVEQSLLAYKLEQLGRCVLAHRQCSGQSLLDAVLKGLNTPIPNLSDKQTDTLSHSEFIERVQRCTRQQP